MDAKGRESGVGARILDTEVTEANRRGTERCIGANAILSVTHQVNPDSPKPDPQIFLCELSFVLSGLCGEIGLRNLGSYGADRRPETPAPTRSTFVESKIALTQQCLLHRPEFQFRLGKFLLGVAIGDDARASVGPGIRAIDERRPQPDEKFATALRVDPAECAGV